MDVRSFDLDESTTRAIRVVFCRRTWQALSLDEVCKVLALVQSDAEALIRAWMHEDILY